GIYYESRFWSGMPDLNLDNDYVRDEITNICHFWIDKGVKGFRLDAVTSYYTGSISKNIDFLTWLNSMVKDYKSDAYIVGEGPWDNVPANIQTYYNSGVDSFFNFTVAQATGHMVGAVNNQTGRAFADFISEYNADLRAINPLAIDAPFLSNHDLGRSAGYFAGIDADYKRKLAASAYLLMPGKPFIYYGEEISLRGSGNDQSKRLPMIWSSTDTTGACNPPVGYDYNLANQVTQGVDDLLLIPDSMTNHYRKVLSLRNYYNDYIASGAVASVTLNDALFALQYTREDNSQILVVTNFSNEPVTADLPNQMTILDQIKTLGIAGSVTNTGGVYSLTVAGYSTLILQ
ncbi:MAG: alpha-amylase family glycosyl hydrolase, partial [Firmicutes bacterium]|nr:alpha-amylase family glycosyl hydrolase [Bacillota bacterium]